MLSLDRWAVARAAQLQSEVDADYKDYRFHRVYQKVHNFCVVEMSGFYLDVLKDRLYTTQTSSLARRSAQTALWHIVEALVRWLAPILCYTSEEIWQALPGTRDFSVMTSTWYTFPEGLADSNIDWDLVVAVRNQVKPVLETQRVQGNIGSPLDAAVTLYCDDKLKAGLLPLADELRFVLITSGAELADDSHRGDATEATDDLAGRLWIAAEAVADQKCERCWHRRKDVGSHAEHATLCGRCVVNVEGDGEQRLFA
jgi:isoleucyl-tRNA synthetase